MPKYVFASLLVSLMISPLAQAQKKLATSNSPQVQQVVTTREAGVDNAWIEPHQQLQRQMIVQAVLQRQAELKRDTEKLVALVAELKQNVDKSNTNILSMDVIKKAQEIQKLAKSVQDKMKNPY
jgi:hypothetical protein